ncbi:MAG: hypothetical protein H0X03_07500 [Nitrosopumilus sp.]|nr:hypothetical protein [Nitrosopumilus sp.]
MIDNYLYKPMVDFFEIDRLLEDLAKIYSTPCAVSWFKIFKNKTPTKEEFRQKVVDFMKDLEYTLAKFPDTNEGIEFKNYSKSQLEEQIQVVLDGKNKEVEKRYKYYAEYT